VQVGRGAGAKEAEALQAQLAWLVWCLGRRLAGGGGDGGARLRALAGSLHPRALSRCLAPHVYRLDGRLGWTRMETTPEALALAQAEAWPLGGKGKGGGGPTAIVVDAGDRILVVRQAGTGGDGADLAGALEERRGLVSSLVPAVVRREPADPGVRLWVEGVLGPHRAFAQFWRGLREDLPAYDE
jgi:hypothetical protein